MSTKKASKKKAKKVKSTNVSAKSEKQTLKIGDFARSLILSGKYDGVEIIKRCNKKPNGKNVNKKHLAWYVHDLKNEKSKHYTEGFAGLQKV